MDELRSLSQGRPVFEVYESFESPRNLASDLNAWRRASWTASRVLFGSQNLSRHREPAAAVLADLLEEL
jgi:hypothetical protein